MTRLNRRQIETITFRRQTSQPACTPLVILVGAPFLACLKGMDAPLTSLLNEIRAKRGIFIYHSGVTLNRIVLYSDTVSRLGKTFFATFNNGESNKRAHSNDSANEKNSHNSCRCSFIWVVRRNGERQRRRFWRADAIECHQAPCREAA